jgi:DNA end-binding protein Ku
MRAIWSGHITFGLITIPVGLYSAVEASEQVSFRLLHRKDHSPIKYKKFCTKEDVEVPNDEIVKGYEVSKGKFAFVEKEELEDVEEELGKGERAIEVLQFVDFGALNPLSFEKPYYLAPMKGGEKAYGVLREALIDANRVGITRFHLRTKPLLGALIPGKEALSLEVLRAFEELRDPASLPLPPQTKKPAEVKMARMLIDQLSTEEWEPAAHPNEYRKALKKLLASKAKFAVAPAAKAGKKGEEEGQVVDLMEALKRSVAQAGGRAKPKKAGTAKRGAA